MAADLEFRVDAELGGIKKAIADLRAEFGALGRLKVPPGSFDGVEKGATGANRAVDKLRDGFAKLGQAGRENLDKLRVGQQLTDGLSRAGRAADELKRKLADVNKPPPGGGGGSNPLAPIEGSANGAILAVKGLVAAFATIQTVRVVADLADQSANLSGRLRLVTNSQEEFNAAYAGLFRIAQSTRQPLEATVGLYTKLAQNLTDTPQALLRLTETIGKAVALSGSSAQASEAAIVQLGQGLASGTLRGEELNSVLEQTPALADAIAKGLGITRGELRKYAEQGKITADAIKKALDNQAGAVDAAFAKLPTTIGQSVVLLKNSALQYVGIFDEANGLSAGFSVTIKALADNLGTLVAAFGAVVAVPIAVAIGRASVALVGLVTAARASTVALGGAAVAARGFAAATAFLGGPVGIILSLLGLSAAAYIAYKTNAEVANRAAATSTERSTDQIITAIRKQIDEIKERNRILGQGADVAAPPSQARADLTTAEKDYRDALAKLGTGQNEAQNIAFAEIARTRGEAYGRIAAEVNKLNDAETVSLRLAQRQKQVDYLKEYANNAEKLAAELKKAKDELGPLFTADIEARIREKFKPKGSDADAKKAARDAAAAALESVKVEADLAVDQTARALKVIDGLYADNLISIRDYYSAKTTLEQSSIDLQIQGLETERALAKEAADRIKIDGDIAKLRRDRADVADSNARAEIAANRKIADSLAEISGKLLALSGDEVGARRAELERQYADLIAALEARSDTAGVSLVRRLINTEVARAQFDALKAEFDRVQQDLQNRQQQIADQRNAGGLTPAIAEQQTSDARQQAEAELRRINEQLQELAKNTNDPAIVRGASEAAEALRRLGADGAKGLDRALIDLRASLANLRDGFAQTSVGAGVDAVTGLFTNLASGSKSAGEAVRDFVRGFVASMAQIAARALATIAVLRILQAVQALSGGGGGILSTVISAAVNHAGGMAGTGPRRMVNPLVFAGAPRFHSGGLVGLAPDERPAILQTGERVLNRQQTADYNGGGAGSGGGTRVINVIDPNLVQDYMTSSAGERTILNVIERNAGAVRQKIA